MADVIPPPSLNRQDQVAIDDAIELVIDAIDESSGADLQKRIAQISQETCKQRDSDFRDELELQINLAVILLAG